MKKTLSSGLVFLLFLTPSISQERALSPALSSLVAAERAFARTSVEKGVRASFLEFFAEDAISFDPHPVNAKEAILKRPAPATRPPVVLDWQPAYADVSRAGDLGYTTGPYTFTDKSPEKRATQYGFYFSIWKKQGDGSWKVVLDCGIKTPDHSRQKFVFTAARQSHFDRGASEFDRERQRDSLINVDREFLKVSNSRGVANAFLTYLSDGARLHRNGIFPVLGSRAILSFLSGRVMRLAWEPIGADVSQSGDLGYTYGSYELTSPESNGVEKGYYVRVWKREHKGDWKLVLDTLSPIPPEGK